MLIPIGFLAASGAGAAGSYDLLATTILSSSQASVTFSSLGDYAGTYQHLQLRAVLAGSSSYESNIRIRFNADTGNNYKSHYLVGTGSAVFGDTKAETNGIYSYYMDTGSLTNEFGGAVIDLLDPFETAKNTTLRMFSGAARSSTPRLALTSGAWFNTSALTSIELNNTSSNFRVGSRLSLYGLRSS